MRIENVNIPEGSKIKDGLSYGNYPLNVLDDDHYNYLSGMNEVREVTIDQFLDNFLDLDCEIPDSLLPIVKELLTKVLDKLKEEIDTEIEQIGCCFIEDDESITAEMIQHGKREWQEEP